MVDLCTYVAIFEGVMIHAWSHNGFALFAVLGVCWEEWARKGATVNNTNNSDGRNGGREVRRRGEDKGRTEGES